MTKTSENCLTYLSVFGCTHTARASVSDLCYPSDTRANGTKTS